MSMILDDHFGMPVFNSFRQPAQHTGTTDTGHIFQTDFRCTGLYQLIGNIGVIFYRMHRRMSNTKSSLWNHAAFNCVLNRRNYVAYFVQPTKNPCNVHTLGMLYFIHQPTYIRRYGIHTQPIQATIEHMGLDAGLIKRFGKCTHRLIRIFSIQKIHLLKSSSIGFDTGKTTHLYNQRSNSH